ncbi:MAG TPA: sigma-70 family RNA polymerase sigma factor [Acidimicrobiales bacterium]|jgi:RNA polymerase sigma-70 factor (ECF subfamily)|nr:sigma-70 family RNA polymerase sigma factor [Acidimicrobiales bacterium]
MVKLGSSPNQSAREEIPDFEAFFREHYRSVVRLAASVLGDFHAAQDVAQDVFFAAHTRFHGDVDRAPGWVRIAAVHASLNRLRGDRRRDRRHELTAVSEAVAGPEDSVLERETRAELRQALGRLSSKSATVLVLRHGGMSYVEIAEVMEIKVGQVGTLLRRAEAALSKEMHHASRV